MPRCPVTISSSPSPLFHPIATLQPWAFSSTQHGSYIPPLYLFYTCYAITTPRPHITCNKDLQAFEDFICSGILVFQWKFNVHLTIFMNPTNEHQIMHPHQLRTRHQSPVLNKTSSRDLVKNRWKQLSISTTITCWCCSQKLKHGIASWGWVSQRRHSHLLRLCIQTNNFSMLTFLLAIIINKIKSITFSYN